MTGNDNKYRRTTQSKSGKPPVLPVSIEELRNCEICPRSCHADRSSDKPGYCRAGLTFPIASICSHMGEEPVFSGKHGICNIFFAHCNLQCIYCQNHQISSNKHPISDYERELPDIISQIEDILDAGAIAVGFVSPSHCIPQMLAIMDSLHSCGRNPIYVYNTNSYDCVDTIKALENRIDVYLPDMKYMDPRLAHEYSDARDYVPVATAAIREMYRQKGAEIDLNKDGLITSGMIIRHLVLPGHISNSREVLRFIAEDLSPDVYISLMAQYYPAPTVSSHPTLGRCLRQEEYDKVIKEFENLDFYRGWVQDLSSPSVYLPDFFKRHPFEN